MTTQTEALKLALEALDQLTNAADTFSVSGVYFNEEVWAKKCLSDAYFAITTIEEALAQTKQDNGKTAPPKGWGEVSREELIKRELEMAKRLAKAEKALAQPDNQDKIQTVDSSTERKAD